MAPFPDLDRQLGWEVRYSSEYPQGQFLRHEIPGYTLIQWWDRCQGDTRGACNSTILLEGLGHSSERLLLEAAEHFPQVLQNLAQKGVKLVEVLNEQLEGIDRMRHALGVQRKGGQWTNPFRNHYVAAENALRIWQRLEASGLAKLTREPSELSGGDAVYSVTEKGREVALSGVFPDCGSKTG